MRRREAVLPVVHSLSPPRTLRFEPFLKLYIPGKVVLVALVFFAYRALREMSKACSCTHVNMCIWIWIGDVPDDFVDFLVLNCIFSGSPRRNHVVAVPAHPCEVEPKQGCIESKSALGWLQHLVLVSLNHAVLSSILSGTRVPALRQVLFTRRQKPLRFPSILDRKPEVQRLAIEFDSKSYDVTRKYPENFENQKQLYHMTKRMSSLFSSVASLAFLTSVVTRTIGNNGRRTCETVHPATQPSWLVQLAKAMP